MVLFGGLLQIKGVMFLILCLLGVLFGGYALGRITIKGVSLGDAGVFIVALLFGALLFTPLTNQLLVTAKAPVESSIVIVADEDAEVKEDEPQKGTLYITDDDAYKDTTKTVEEKVGNELKVEYVEKALEIVEKLGLIFFVAAVGFIAGPKFFGNLKKNFKSYVLLGVIIIVAGGLAAAGCIGIASFIGYGAGCADLKEFTAMIVGLLSGSLTSTPAFTAAKDTVFDGGDKLVTVGHGIAYIFGVLGVVLFVQIVPKLMKANMSDERAKLETVSGGEVKKEKKNLFKLDAHGFAVFSIVALLGIVLGSIKIPLPYPFDNATFSLTPTGGCLLAALIFGHFGNFGKLSVMPDDHTLKLFRELGLVLFLFGAGVAGGKDFKECFDIMYFVYGAIMTIVPMIVGFFFAKYVLKLSLLNNLGAMTGGMTSTPALGTLIGVSGTEAVASAYAATYPVALIAVVLVSQILLMIFGASA